MQGSSGSTRIDRTYRSGDIVMTFTDYAGPADHTFVLVHGIGMGRVVFAEVAKTLSAHGRVIAMDLPGFGDSPESETASSIEATARAVQRFIEDECVGAGAEAAASAGPVTLVGHSMGTQVCAEVANRAPDLLEALVLIAPTVNRHERTARQQAARMIQDLSGEGPRVLLLGAWQYTKTSPLWFTQKLKFMLNHHIERICPTITVPTLVMTGETDRVCPPDWVSEVAALIPRSTMREIPGMGHGAIIEAAEPSAAMILEFLASER